MIMSTKTILIISFFSFFYSCDNSNDTGVKYSSMDDSLTLVKMVHARENAMKKKDISAVMAQFSDDATFINGEGYYLANKEEIADFHKGLTQSEFYRLLLYCGTCSCENA
jgi:hypothetical protein